MPLSLRLSLVVVLLVPIILSFVEPTAAQDHPVSDQIGPTLQSLSVDKTMVNAGQTVTARITDAESGVKYAYIFWRLPNGDSAPASGSFVFIAGTAQDGTWRAIVQVPLAAASGTWTVSSVSVRDEAGNSTYLNYPAPPTPNGNFTVVIKCDPRPKAVVSVERGQAAGTLEAKIAAGQPSGGSGNQLRSLRFGEARNALILILNRPAFRGNLEITLPTGTVEVRFVVKRERAGEPVHVPIIVYDDCGDWKTFVGGGPGAF